MCSGCCSRFLRLLRSELRCARVWVTHEDKNAFTYLPWFPVEWKLQWIFVVYRWVLALYFLAWFIYTLVEAHEIGFKYLIYLTHWGFIVWNTYLIVAASLVTWKFIEQTKCSQSGYSYSKSSTDCNVYGLDHRETKETGCCGCDLIQDETSWKEKIQWVLFTISLEFAVGISILFWAFFYDPNDSEFLFSPYSLHVHLINGASALIDLWLVSIPVRLLHVFYVLFFGSAYAAFTGLYYLFNGTDPAGNHYIYPMLDYEGNPGYSSGLVIVCILVFLTLLHLFFFGQYLVRNWITYRIRRRYGPQMSYEQPVDQLLLPRHSDTEIPVLVAT